MLTLLEFYQHLETSFVVLSPVTNLISNKTNQHPRDTFCNYIRQNRQFHFLGLMDLGFEIQKTDFGIRICILEIQCVPIAGKMNKFDFFGPNLPKSLPKNWFLAWNSENKCWNKNQHSPDTMCANFQTK